MGSVGSTLAHSGCSSVVIRSGMDAIKKKMQAMKVEKDNACDKMDACEEAMKTAKIRAQKGEDEVAELDAKAKQLETELDLTAEKLGYLGAVQGDEGHPGQEGREGCGQQQTGFFTLLHCHLHHGLHGRQEAHGNQPRPWHHRELAPTCRSRQERRVREGPGDAFVRDWSPVVWLSLEDPQIHA